MTSLTWITLLAYEARTGHAADSRRAEEAAKRLASAHSRIVADLRRAIAVEIEGFLQANGESLHSELTCRNSPSAQGFVVSRTRERLASRRLAVDLESAALMCRYDVGEGRAGAAAEPLAIEIARGGAALSFWDEGVNRSFATVEDLGAFLLEPILAA